MRRLYSALFMTIFMLGACSSADSIRTETQPERPTVEEYRAAVEKKRDCMLEDGWDAGQIEEQPDGQINFSFTDLQEEELDDADSVFWKRYNYCEDTHTAEIERNYFTYRYFGDERDQKMAELIECLEAGGYTGFDPNTTDSTDFYRLIVEEDERRAHAGEVRPQMDGESCMNRYLGVWPPGDPNNP